MILACRWAQKQSIMAKKPRFRRRTVFAKNIGFSVGFGYRNNTTRKSFQKSRQSFLRRKSRQSIITKATQLTYAGLSCCTWTTGHALVWQTKMDVQRHKLETVISQTMLTTLATIDVLWRQKLENLLSSQPGSRFQGSIEVPTFLKIPEFPYNTV